MPAFKGWRQERIKTLDYRIPSGDTCYCDNSLPDHRPISLPCESKARRSRAQSCSRHTKTEQSAAEGGSEVICQQATEKKPPKPDQNQGAKRKS